MEIMLHRKSVDSRYWNIEGKLRGFKNTQKNGKTKKWSSRMLAFKAIGERENERTRYRVSSAIFLSSQAIG